MIHVGLLLFFHLFWLSSIQKSDLLSSPKTKRVLSHFQEVAVKMMKSSRSKEFFAELKVLCKIHHINVVSIYWPKNRDVSNDLDLSCIKMMKKEGRVMLLSH